MNLIKYVPQYLGARLVAGQVIVTHQTLRPVLAQTVAMSETQVTNPVPIAFVQQQLGVHSVAGQDTLILQTLQQELVVLVQM